MTECSYSWVANAQATLFQRITPTVRIISGWIVSFLVYGSFKYSMGTDKIDKWTIRKYTIVSHSIPSHTPIFISSLLVTLEINVSRIFVSMCLFFTFLIQPLHLFVSSTFWKTFSTRTFETPTVQHSSRIWTQATESIFYGDNCLFCTNNSHHIR